jgi:hypothetical protein
LISQSKAILISLSANDNFDCLTRDTIAASLGLMSDQLERIEQQCNDLFEEIKA